MSAPTDLSRLRLGTAPDSWGVWFPEDPHQVTWRQYLDEVARAGYVWTELGPQGFLPQDPEQLRDELGSRGLQVCGGTVFAGLHKGKEALDAAIEAFGREARLLSAVGAKYLIHLPEQYTDMHTGTATEAADLETEQWDNLISGTDELGRVMAEEYGIWLVFHPHVDTHVDTQERVERFLQDTDPRYGNLGLDTVHISYADGDNGAIHEAFPDRSDDVHLKQRHPRARRGPPPPAPRRAPPAGRPTAPGPGAGGAPAAPRCRQARPDARASVRHSRNARAARRAGAGGQGSVRRHRAGPVSRRAR